MPSPWLISTHTMHTPSPWMTSSHPTHSNVSIAGQPPRSKHPCLHFWPAHTNVSIAGQHPPSKHPCLHLWPASTHQGHCCASPGRGLSTSSTEIGYLTKVSWPPGLPHCNLYYEPGIPGRRKKKISPLGHPYAAQGPITPSL